MPAGICYARPVDEVTDSMHPGPKKEVVGQLLMDKQVIVQGKHMVQRRGSQIGQQSPSIREREYNEKDLQSTRPQVCC